MSYTRALALLTNVLLAGAAVAPVQAVTPPSRPVLVSEERALMGTQVIVKAVGNDREQLRRAVNAAFDEVSRLERLMSNFLPETELSRINQQAGVAPVAVSRELLQVIQRSLFFSRLSDGAFDISFASVGKLWNFRAGVIPDPAAVKAQLPFVDYRKVRVDDDHSTVFLPAREMEIGLGGIGKGYAMDRAMAVLNAHGVHNAMVMAGGDTLIRGTNGDDLWRIGLRDPDKADGILAVLPLEDQAVSTSGDYERFFVKDGVRYHHILDTTTGYPAKKSRSATILATDAMTSDALSTTVFVLGPEQGLALVEQLDDVEAIIIDRNGDMHLSSGLAGLGLGAKLMEHGKEP
ncbi:MAG: FAD:protein FMN transferase [Nitrospirota bacterium]